MGRKGTGYFDRKGSFHKTARAATESDLAALFGQIGEGESLAPGIANLLLQKRGEIEQLFAEHDQMMADDGIASIGGSGAKLTDISGTVSKLPHRPAV